MSGSATQLNLPKIALVVGVVVVGVVVCVEVGVVVVGVVVGEVVVVGVVVGVKVPVVVGVVTSHIANPPSAYDSEAASNKVVMSATESTQASELIACEMAGKGDRVVRWGVSLRGCTPQSCQLRGEHTTELSAEGGAHHRAVS